MSEQTADALSHRIAELAFCGVKAGIPILEIPKFVQNQIEAEFEVQSTEMLDAMKIIFSGDNAISRLLM